MSRDSVARPTMHDLTQVPYLKIHQFAARARLLDGRTDCRKPAAGWAGQVLGKQLDESSRTLWARRRHRPHLDAREHHGRRERDLHAQRTFSSGERHIARGLGRGERIPSPIASGEPPRRLTSSTCCPSSALTIIRLNSEVVGCIRAGSSTARHWPTGRLAVIKGSSWIEQGPFCPLHRPAPW